MPRIPTYQPGGTVELAALPGAKQQSIASPEMFFNDGGAGEFSKAMKPVVTALQQEAERVDEARVQEKYAQLAKAANQSIYGDGGVTSQLGSRAVGAADRWGGDYDKVTNELAADLSPRQQAMFGKYAMHLKLRNQDVVLRHESAQVKAHRDESFKQLLETGMETAALNYNDGTMIGMQIGIAEEALRKRPEYLGASADVRAGMEKDVRGGFHSAAIMRALESGDTAGANGYFEGVKVELPLKLRSELERKLKPATDFSEGKGLALEVQDKIAAGQMSIAEGERYIIEKSRSKEAASVAQSIMREMQDAQKREADKVTGGLVEKFELKPSRSTMNAIMGDKTFQAMEPDKRANLVKYMRSELEQADDRARVRRNEQYRSPQNYSRFLEVLESPQFASKSREEIFALQPELGPDLTRQLLAEHKSQQGTASKFQIDKDLLDGAMAGIKDKGKQATYRGIVESELQKWKAANPGKLPTLEQQQQIVRSGNAEYIDIGKVWNSSGERYTLESDPTAVPKDFYTQAKAWAAKQGRNITDADILAAWNKQKGAQ